MMSSFQLYEIDMHLEELREMIVQKCRLFSASSLFILYFHIHVDPLNVNLLRICFSNVYMRSAVYLCVRVCAEGKSVFLCMKSVVSECLCNNHILF